MIHSYAFSNVRSFRERVEVSFTLTERDAVDGWDRISPLSGQRLTTAIAVLGPNASGKSSLIQPLAFLAWFVRYSFNLPPEGTIPVAAHFDAPADATEFELVVDATQPETLLRYRLSVTASHVLAESLERKVRRGQWTAIFDRRRALDNKYKVFQDGFGLDQAQADNVRPNVSLISWAAQYGVAFAQEIVSFWFATNMFVGGRWWQPHDQTVQQCVQQFARAPELRKRLPELLSKWDFGLADVRVQEVETPSPTGDSKKEWYAFGVHHDAHKREHLLPFLHESSGTKTAFALLTQFLPVLANGGLIAYDELDSDLHPHTMAAILDLFAGEETNPHGAQIIFTCHAVEVLRLLQKSQIMLVEKDGLDSHAWRLDSMEGVRADENRVAKYLSGTYGAVPRQ
jgi:hypothetical protein